MTRHTTEFSKQENSDEFERTVFSIFLSVGFSGHNTVAREGLLSTQSFAQIRLSLLEPLPLSPCSSFPVLSEEQCLPQTNLSPK